MTEAYKQEIKAKTELFGKNILKNMFRLEPFYNFNFYLFCQQKVLIDEVLNCLLLGFNQASIFTTNHLLERMLKVSLMRNHTKGLFIGNSEFNKKSEEAKNKYDNQTLDKNIKCAFDLGILNQEERDKLIELKKNFVIHIHTPKCCHF